MLINCPLRQGAIALPDAPAVRDAGRVLSFAQLDCLVTGYVRKLEDIGIRAGSYVGILSSNSLEYVALLIALARCGAIAVPLNTRLSEAELMRQVEQPALAILLTDAEQSRKSARISARHALIDSLRDQGVSPASSLAPISIDVNQCCCILFTSGSSGSAKRVSLSLGNLYYNALGSNENIPLQTDDTWLLSLPLFHVGGLGIMFRCLLAGAAMYVVDRFEAATINDLIDSHQVTHLSLVPAMLSLLLEARDRNPFPETLKVILLGGAPLPGRLLQQIRERGLPVVMSYGMTETASQVAATSLSDPPARLQTSGRVLRYGEISIDTETDSPFGEILVRGPIVSIGYLTSSPAPGSIGEWFHTGDIGAIDREGYLTVVGRKDEMFISGGENIYPREIENVAAGIHGVAEAAVTPIDDQLWGKRPLLLIVPTEGNAPDKEKIISEMAKQLARFKLPDRIIVVEKLPHTALGKIDRLALARLAETQTD